MTETWRDFVANHEFHENIRVVKETCVYLIHITHGVTACKCVSLSVLLATVLFRYIFPCHMAIIAIIQLKETSLFFFCQSCH